MFNNSYKIMFTMMMMISTIISISSNSWLVAWMGLEINLLSFIPLMSDNKLMSTEASMKYFLTQALTSSTILFTIMLMFIYNNYFLNMMMISSLMMKLGSAPFHYWFIDVMENISWNNNLILMTWQKLAPLILISYMMNKIIIIYIILSLMISTIKGINQTSIRKLMAYSSVNNLSWMLSSMNNHKLMMIYFLIYSLMSFSLIMIFNMLKISHMNQLFMMMNNKSMKIFIMLNTISMAGMPPFLGFIPKWLVIQELIFFNNYFLSWMLMMSSLIMIYLYLRLYYMTLLLNNHKLMIFNKNYYNNNYLMSIMLLSIINFLSLLMIPLYFNF
nr:NADH dehydrogenase subunit 2 [Brachytarsina amboinensis]